MLGGGPAGCATALALRLQGVERVLIAEAGDADALRVGESVPPETRALLERIGVWDEFRADEHDPCLGSCSSWGSDELGYNDFLFNPHGPGWHLDRRRFDGLLVKKAASSGVEVRHGSRFASCERTGDGAFVVHLTQGDGAHAARARFVVDATGAHSRVARAMGARRILHDRLTCVAAFLTLPATSALSRLTLLEAVEYGWWYAARLPGDRCAVAVASDPEIVKQAALHTPDGWLTALRTTRHCADVLAAADLGGEPLVVRTAPSFKLDAAAGTGWLAVGDAASAYDPISSQGIYKALLDGIAAADAIVPQLRSAVAGVPDGYDAAIAARFTDYLANRDYFYSVERRWASAPFWQARRTGRSRT